MTKNRKESIRRSFLLAVPALAVLLLAGCGKTNTLVRIHDRDMVTEFEVGLPDTVANVLKTAEITLGEGDTVSPGADEKLTEETDIVINRHSFVTFVVEGESRPVEMVGGKVSDLLAQEGIVLDDDQSVVPEEGTWITDGMEVVITRSYVVQLTVDGSEETAATEAKTVGELLEDAGIRLNEADRVSPETSAQLESGMHIVVQRVTVEEVTETESIPFETVRQNDSSLSKGTETIGTAGQEGEKSITWRVTFVDGAEESREWVGEEIVREPVNEVVLVGTKTAASAPSGNGGGQPAPSAPYEVSRTPYPNCDDPNHGYYEIQYSDGTVQYVEY